MTTDFSDHDWNGFAISVAGAAVAILLVAIFQESRGTGAATVAFILMTVLLLGYRFAKELRTTFRSP